MHIWNKDIRFTKLNFFKDVCNAKSKNNILMCDTKRII